MIKNGVRVVRGPNWKWGNQDNGKGHIGTIKKISKDGNKVLVDWDKQLMVQLLLPMMGLMDDAKKYNAGDKYWYRVGENQCYDLRLFDSGAAGILHNGVSCSFCQLQRVKGLRWRCLECQGYNLCTTCYMADKHDTCHQFLRVEMPGHIGVKVSTRCCSPENKVQDLKRSDWNGRRKGGSVFQDCYTTHLPVVGLTTASLQAVQSKCAVGDRVEVNVTPIGYALLQVAYGGINDTMIQHTDSVGTVIHVNPSGAPFVQYVGCHRSWTINGEALIKRSGCACDFAAALATALVLGSLLPSI